MDFIAYEPSGLLYTLLGIVLASCLFGLIGNFVFDKPSVMFGCIAIAAIALGISFAIPNPYGEWRKEIKAEIKDTYGLKITDEQLKELKYPYTDSKPEESFKQYGSITTVKPESADGFEKTEVYLLWSKGEMVLAAPDEQKNLQPLKTQN